MAARLVAVIGLRPYLYVDSAEYDILDFSGRSRRPWATPLLYQLVPGDDRWELTAQAMIGGLAWAVLALVFLPWFRDRRVGRVAAAAVVALGLTTSVTNWDTAMLSESLAVSSTVLLVAAWLHLARCRTWGGVGAVAAATLPWLFVRQSLLPTSALVILAAAIAAVVLASRRRRWQPFAAGAAVTLLLTGLATVSYGRNQEVVDTNLTVIVANRVVTDPGRFAWFRDAGMPVPPTGDTGFDALDTDPAFQQWVHRTGRSTYVRYLASHPWYTLTEPLNDLVSVRISWLDEPEQQVTMLSPADSYGRSRPVLPEAVEEVLFAPGSTGGIIFLLLAALGWTAAWWRRRDARWVFAMALVGISLASLIGGWHGATPELNRLALIGALGLRLGLLLQFGLLVDRWLADRRPPLPPTAPCDNGS